MDNANKADAYRASHAARTMMGDEIDTTPWPTQDTRPDIGGFPLPWRIDSKSHEDVVLDADGDELMSFSKELDHGFWEGIVAAVNRSLAIEEAAKTLVARSFKSVKMSKSRSILIECNDGDRGEIVHGADYDALVEALESRS